MCAPGVAYWRRSNLGDVVFMVPGASKSSQLITTVSQAHRVPPILLLWVVVFDLRFMSPCMWC
jgi:hypothetical protein